MRVIPVNTLYNYIAYLAGKDIAGGYLPPDRFNEMLPILVNKIVRKYYGPPEEYQPGTPMPRVSYEITQLVTDYLSQLKVEIIANVTDAGKMTKPDDYLHKSSMAVSKYAVITQENDEAKEGDCCDCDEDPTLQVKKSNRNITYVEESFYPVTFVKEQDRWAWLNSSLRKPTFENPIAVFMGEDIIQIYPKNVKSTIFTYLRYPLTAKWNYTIVAGTPIYSASGSVDVELPDICADELAVTILDRIGITIREPALVDWSRYINNTGK